MKEKAGYLRCRKNKDVPTEKNILTLEEEKQIIPYLNNSNERRSNMRLSEPSDEQLGDYDFDFYGELGPDDVEQELKF